MTGMYMRFEKRDESGYWITTDVKTDKDGDTIIVVYVGHKILRKSFSPSLSQRRGNSQVIIRI